MPLQSTLRSEGKGLCLLSLDTGGARGISQLKILGEVMHRLNFQVEEDQKLLPCDVFDMIGGSGTGGFIAILLVVFGLNFEQTMDEFADLSVNILEKQWMEAPARTAALRVYIDTLLERHNIERGLRLLDSNIRSKGSKIVIPILYKRHIEHALILRNFEANQQEALNFTITEAILATLASPALFTPLSIVNDASTFEYISGDFKLSNPTRTIVSEAYGAFGGEARVACLLSLGGGHSGIISAPESSDLANWSRFLENAVMDNEQRADEIESQMGHLGLYQRFSVTRGLEEEGSMKTPDIIAHTTVYLAGATVSGKLDLCAKSLRLRDGVASLDQLKHSGSQSVLPPALPLPIRTFVMRKKPWNFIEKALIGLGDSNESDGPRMLVVTGMGGCGKTQLILKFMHVHKNKFAATLFIDGSSASRIRADIIRHVRSLDVAHSQMGFEDCLIFLARPSTSGSQLIFYDNVDDPDIDIAPLLPSGESCVIVITSRNRSLGQLSPDEHLELDVMSMDEAVDLLLHHPGRSPVITDHMRREAGAVAQALGCLPIALTQAHSYMFQTQCSAREYLARLSINRDKLLAQPIKHQRDMRYLSTYAALDASFGLLTIRCQHLLRLLSYFHWADFPLALVIVAVVYSFSHYRITYIEHGDEYYTGRAMLEAIFIHEGKFDSTELDEMVVLLRNHSLVTLIAGTGTRLVQMHPVAHGWVNSSIPEQEKAKYQSAAILLLALGSRNEYTSPAKYLASHVMHMSPLWNQLHVNSTEAFAGILDNGGLYGDALKLREEVVAGLRSQTASNMMSIPESTQLLAMSYNHVGRDNDAEPLQLESLKLRTETLGEGHPRTIHASSNLASTYQSLGRLNEAEVLQKKVLKTTKEILGERHTDTIAASSNLASTYSGLGQLEEAEALQKEVLKLRKETLGERHPITIAASNNLAATYFRLGRIEEAEALQKKVLKLRKEILGERHPATITASGNLASFYFRLGRIEEAEALLKEVLKLMKEILGERHPETISASSNLAATYSGLGRLEEAEALQKGVLKLRKETMGERHPDTITDSSNLVVIYYSLGRLKEAEVLQKEVLKLLKEILGERHPDTITASSNLAATYCNLGRLKEAEPLQEEALILRKETMGSRHPDTITASSNLVVIYYGLGRLKEAEVLQKGVLKLRMEILGGRHPDTITDSGKLASIYSRLGRSKEAQVLREKVLKLSKQILGEHHPETLGASNNLSDSYLLSGRIGDAEELQVETVRQARKILGSEHVDTALYMFTLAEIYVSLHKKSEALKMLDAAELIFAEKVGKEYRDYPDCLELRSRVQALPDAPHPVTTLDPSQNQPPVAPNPPTSTAIQPSHRRIHVSILLSISVIVLAYFSRFLFG